MAKIEPFKTCSFCKKNWKDRESFLRDSDIELIGYQPDFEDLTAGLLYFNHTTADCGTTLGLPVSFFRSLYDGPVYEEKKRGTQECPGYCLVQDNLDDCPVRCACRFVRSTMQIIKAYNM
jgi:hypothetical protein